MNSASTLGTGACLDGKHLLTLFSSGVNPKETKEAGVALVFFVAALLREAEERLLASAPEEVHACQKCQGKGPVA